MSLIHSQSLSGNFSFSMRVGGAVSDTLVFLSLPVVSGDHDWKSS